MSAKEQKSIPATTLKLLGNKPAEFDMPVTLNQLGGEPLTFSIKCKALKKDEWAALRDARQKSILESMKPIKVEGEEGMSHIDASIAMLDKGGFAVKTVESAKRDADLVMKFAVSWPADEPLNADTLVALENESGGSLDTIINTYHEALFFGRLGN